MVTMQRKLQTTLVTMECIYRLDSTERRNVQCSPESRCSYKTYAHCVYVCIDNKCNHADWPGTHLSHFLFKMYTSGRGPN